MTQSNSVANVVRAELTKIATLPGFLITLAATVVATVGISALTGMSVRAADSKGMSDMLVAGFPPESSGFETAGFGQVGMIVLGVLIVSSEYNNGQIRSSLAAVPSRGLLLAVKASVLAVLVAVAAAVTVGASVVIENLALGPVGLSFDQYTSGMLWNLLGAVINWVLMALIAFGVTVLTRNLIIPLVVLVAMTMGISVFLTQVTPLAKFLPDVAGVQLLIPYTGADLLDPIPGGLVMATWALALGLIGFLVFRRRDA